LVFCTGFRESLKLLTSLGRPENNSVLPSRGKRNGSGAVLIERYKPDYKRKLQDARNQLKCPAKTRIKELNAKGSWKMKGTRSDKRNQQ
jgi:hypothetical protein